MTTRKRWTMVRPPRARVLDWEVRTPTGEWLGDIRPARRAVALYFAAVLRDAAGIGSADLLGGSFCLRVDGSTVSYAARITDIELAEAAIRADACTRAPGFARAPRFTGKEK